MERSDRELLRACGRNDESAWEEIVNRYQRLVYAIPRRAGMDEDLSAEVFQEVFTTLLEKLDDIEQPERLQAWIVTTARRKTWRIMGRERLSTGRLTVKEESDALDRLPDNVPLPDELMLQLEQQHLVRSALLRLDCFSTRMSRRPIRRLLSR
jgi:RNA polymerase sigma factor (sigma-70 family)